MGRPRSYVLWILGHVLRALFALLIAFVCLFLGWRVFLSKRPPKELREISANEVLVNVYAQHGALTVMEQPEQVRYTEGEDNYADYHVANCVFLEEADQVQLLFFYNNSTLQGVSETLAIDPALPRGEEVFGVELLLLVDVSPEGHVGDPVIEERVVHATHAEVGTTSLYTFVRYTFDGVDITDDVAVVYFDIYYEGAERSELGTIRLYHKESRAEYRELTKKEQSVLEGSK